MDNREMILEALQEARDILNVFWLGDKAGRPLAQKNSGL